MGSVMEMRKEIGPEFEKTHGIKLGFMSFFLKAAARGLVERPIVNAVIDQDSEEVIYRNYVDISVAVASPKGLVVPVLRDVQNMTFAGVENNLRSMALKARDGDIAIEDMAGGTFTLSNGMLPSNIRWCFRVHVVCSHHQPPLECDHGYA